MAKQKITPHELRLKVAMFLISSQATRMHTEEIMETTLYKNEFKKWLNMAYKELLKQEKLFAEIWNKDEENMSNILDNYTELLEIISKLKPSDLIRVTQTIRELVANPDFDKIPIMMKKLDNDLLNVALDESTNELTIWITNKPHMEEISKKGVGVEEYVYIEIVNILKSKLGIIPIDSDNNILKVTNGNNIWSLFDKEYNYSLVPVLESKFTITLKPSKKINFDV